jgi:hypothetical protein
MEYNFNTLPNFGVLEVKLEQKHIDLLYSYIKETAYPGYEFEGNTVVKHAKDNQWSLIDHNGVFEEEVLKPAVNKYAQQWGWPMNLKSTHYHDLSFNRFWTRITTNDQYQSLHDHQGVFSFTIWLKIPTDWKDEQEGDAGFAHPEATDFVFTYTDVLGRIQKFNYKLCPDMEGTMVVFPSDFNHMVLPGWTKEGEYRIAVAGDISLASHAPGEQLAG